jgi:hypothetical protein
MRNILELVMQKNDSVWKILPMTFHRSTLVWYPSLTSSSISGIHNIHVKLISHFSTSIPTKKEHGWAFSIAQQEDESARVYV